MTEEILRQHVESVVKSITETDDKQMGFTMDEVNRINRALWEYECALCEYASQESPEIALRWHYDLEDENQQPLSRAFIMLGRKPEKCLEFSNVKN